MRKVVHAELFADSQELVKLLADWSSCVRFTYCRFREGRSFSEVRIAAKDKYPTLSTRQVSDAVTEAKGKHERTQNKEPIVFGGKGLFAKVCAGEVPSDRWRFVRDGMMYARGDRTKTGNPTLRIIRNGNDYVLRVIVGNHDFRTFPLFIPQKFRAIVNEVLASRIAYNVRLRRKDENKYRVIVDFEADMPVATAAFRNGCIGVDTNPDRIAVCLVSPDGNRIESRPLVNTRMFYGSASKTSYEVSLLVKEITDMALTHGVGIAAENLKFRPKFVSGWRKSNRMKSRFVWRSFLTLLERKCTEKGVEFRKVNPAFTSVQGRLKYSQMFNIPVHEASAYVIGRRALGFNEKVSIYGQSPQKVRALAIQTLLEANGERACRFHSWSLWRKLVNVPDLTGRLSSLPNLGEFGGSVSNDRSGGESPPGERTRTGRPRTWQCPPNLMVTTPRTVT